MATDCILGPRSLPASGDLSTKQYLFMKIDTNGQLATNTTSGAWCPGVLQDKPTAQYQPGTICAPGSFTKITSAATLTAGQQIMSNNAGKAVAATSGSHILGIALEGASSGDIFEILYQPMGKL